MARPRPPKRLEEHSIDPEGEFAVNPREHVFMLAAQITHHRDKKLEARMAPLGLSLQHWRCLLVVNRIADCSMSDLSRFGMADRTTLTRSVDQLVAKGLVERHVSPRDRRLVLLRLTKAGDRLYGEAVRVMLALNAEIVACARPVEQRELARALESLLAGLIPDSEDLEAIATFGRPGFLNPLK